MKTHPKYKIKNIFNVRDKKFYMEKTTMETEVESFQFCINNMKEKQSFQKLSTTNKIYREKKTLKGKITRWI